MQYSRDAGYIWDMLEAARGIMRCTEGLDIATYSSSELNRLATERLFTVLGEASRRVSDELKQANPNIPWQLLTDMRNVLAHEYDKVRDDIVFSAIQENLAGLITQLEELLPPLPEE